MAGRPKGRIFVGRAHEQRVLRAHLADAFGGSGGVVLVAGEAGVGKTALASRIADYARSKGARVAWARGSDASARPRFWLWLQVLADLGAQDRELARVQDCGASTGAEDPIASRTRKCPSGDDLARSLAALEVNGELISGEAWSVFESISAYLRRRSRRQALLIVLDDIHHAEGESLFLAEFVAASVRDARILIVATYQRGRAEHSREFTWFLGSMAGVARVVPLAPFDRAELRAYVAARVGRSQRCRAMRGLMAQSGGNPQLLEAIFSSRHGQQLATRGTPGEPDAAASVPEVIDGRLRHLSSEAHAALRAAAVIGSEYSADVVRTLASLSTDAADRALAELVADGLAARTSASRGAFRFASTLVRDRVLEQLRESERRRLHRRAGEYLEQCHQRDTDVCCAALATHFAEAATPDEQTRALRYAWRAADLASQRRDYAEAARYYAMALRAGGSGGAGDEDDRLLLLVELAHAQHQLRDYPAASAALSSAVEISRSRGVQRQEQLAAARASDANSHVGPCENLFRREGDYWTIVYEARLIRLRHVNGLTAIQFLIRRPGEPFHVTRVAAAMDHDGASAVAINGVRAPAVAGNGGAVRLGEGDSRDAAKGETNGGGDHLQRMRVRVTKAVHAALEKIVEHHPVLGHRLGAWIKTGMICSYAPDPAKPAYWLTS